MYFFSFVGRGENGLALPKRECGGWVGVGVEGEGHCRSGGRMRLHRLDGREGRMENGGEEEEEQGGEEEEEEEEEWREMMTLH